MDRKHTFHMSKHTWDVARLLIGNEIDNFYSEHKASVESITITKQELNELYFNIRERIERNIQIHEES